MEGEKINLKFLVLGLRAEDPGLTDSSSVSLPTVTAAAQALVCQVCHSAQVVFKAGV